MSTRIAPDTPPIANRTSCLGRLSDGELIIRVARRDHDAFAALYRRFSRRVQGLALRRIGDRQRAEEVTQETFAAVWRSAATYRPDRGPGAPWLYAIARNAVANLGRVRITPTSESIDVPSGEPEAHQQAEAEWLQTRVHRALAELPDNHRVVIELAYWRGLSQSEIALQLEVPLGTVKTRTRSALRKLAELLDDEELASF
jgi:RNA polymerase sigma-70 factor, ECF subfamily